LQYLNFAYCVRIEIEPAAQTKNFLAFPFRLAAGGLGGAAKK